VYLYASFLNVLLFIAAYRKKARKKASICLRLFSAPGLLNLIPYTNLFLFIPKISFFSINILYNMATPNLSLVPAISTTYNVGMAETFSWVPMQGLDRPLFARATYLANASDISVSLSANDIVLNIDEVEDLLKDTITLLATLTSTSNRINGFVVPDYNKIKNFYYGSSTNISSVQYLQDTTVVAELSFTYVDPVSAEGARLDEVIKL
jgi:hypothetical protein